MYFNFFASSLINNQYYTSPGKMESGICEIGEMLDVQIVTIVPTNRTYGERTRARRCNLQCPQGCRLILARSLFSSVPKARDKSNNARARGDLEFLRRHRNPLDINTPGTDNAGWRVIVWQKRNTIHARSRRAAVDVLKRSFREMRGYLRIRGLSSRSIPPRFEILAFGHNKIYKNEIQYYYTYYIAKYRRNERQNV